MTAVQGPAADQARELHRSKTTGEFGTQHHGDPGVIELDRDLTQAQSYTCPDCARWTRTRIGAPQKAPCIMCGGTGQVTVDPDAIGKALVSSRDGSFRKSRPPLVDEKNGVYGAAYVWRLIRFNNGQDMCMPVTAAWYVGFGGIIHDEEKAIMPHLETLIDRFGEEHFGRVEMMRGAARWGKALGMEGADQVADYVDRTVGLPSGNGTDIGGFDESPEAFVETHSDGDGNFDPDDSLLA